MQTPAATKRIPPQNHKTRAFLRREIQPQRKKQRGKVSHKIFEKESISAENKMMFPATQNERFRQQLDASQPLKKQLWQQTIKTKIENQTAILRQCKEKKEIRKNIKSLLRNNGVDKELVNSLPITILEILENQ